MECHLVRSRTRREARVTPISRILIIYPSCYTFPATSSTHTTRLTDFGVRVPEVVLPEQTPTLSDEHDWSISDTLSRRHSIQRALGVPELVRACLPRVNKSSDECAFPGIDCLLKVSQPTCMSKDYHQLMKKKKKKLEGRHLQWKLAAATFFHRKATLISKLNCVCTHRTNCIIGI